MMWRVPSVAVGTVQPRASAEPMVCGLLGALVNKGLSVQAFADSAVPQPGLAVQRITGRPLRHLDPWLQSSEQTLAAWYRGASDCRAGILFGHFDSGRKRESGGLGSLAQRLGLPQIAIVDVSQLDGCRIPMPPSPLAGIFLDRTAGARCRLAWETMLEGLWGAPVLGWLDESLPARRMFDLLAPAQTPSAELVADLADAFSQSLTSPALCHIAHRAPSWPIPSAVELAGSQRRGVRIAVAYDDAFPSYAAETLELLEAAGARVADFSPLHSERLPDETDVVVIGTGTADRFWPELARNCCLQQSLRNFAARGGRVYAEGSGLAYISRQAVLPEAGRIPMAGLLPVEARRASATRHVAAQLTMAHASWLFARGEIVRGYRESGWEIVPAGPLQSYPLESQRPLDVVARRHVIGSQLILHFASQPAMLERLLVPFAPARSAVGAAR